MEGQHQKNWLYVTVYTNRLASRRREGHAFVWAGHAHARRDDELAAGVEVPEAGDFGVGTEAGFRVLHVVARVAGVVVLDDQVEQLLVAIRGVGARVARVDANLAASVQGTCKEQYRFCILTEPTSIQASSCYVQSIQLIQRDNFLSFIGNESCLFYMSVYRISILQVKYTTKVTFRRSESNYSINQQSWFNKALSGIEPT